MSSEPGGLRMVVVGASAAGLRAAARARRLLPQADIVVLDAEETISLAACGLPYFVSGDISEGAELKRTSYGMVRDPAYFRDVKGLDVRTGMRVEKLDREAGEVHAVSVNGGEKAVLPYDRLVLTTGASPVRIAGVDFDSPKVSTFKTLEEAVALRQQLQTGQIDRVAIVGAGFIGCELAEAFTARWGASVDLIEAQDRVLPQLLDEEMALLVQAHLESQGVAVHTHCPVELVDQTGDGVCITTPDGPIETGHVIVAVGVRPNVEFAREAGVEIGLRGGLVVDDLLRTSDPNIYAGGDCIEVTHCVSGQPLVIPLGSLANRQGRAIGNNLAGGETHFGPVAGSAAVKVFDLNVATAGLTATAAEAAGLSVSAVWGSFPAIAHYYPEGEEIQLKLVYEAGTDRLVGLQGVGKGDVVKRADVFGNLLLQGGTLESLLDAEFAYAPPYAPAVDPLFALGAMALDQEQEGVGGINPMVDLSASVLLDVRLPEEIEAAPFDTDSAVRIPLHELRGRLDEVPSGQPVVVLCERGPRAAEAARLLLQAGRENVSYLGGGRQLREKSHSS